MAESDSGASHRGFSQKARGILIAPSVPVFVSDRVIFFMVAF